MSFNLQNCDRFIPNRQQTRFELASPFYQPHAYEPQTPTASMRSCQNLNYLQQLTNALYNMSLSDAETSPMLWSHNTPRPQSTATKPENIPSYKTHPIRPEKSLGAPSINKNFYHHILSTDQSKFAFALNKTLYVRNMTTGHTAIINGTAEVSCTHLLPDSKLFIGNCANSISLVDYNYNKTITQTLLIDDALVNVAETDGKHLFLGCRNSSIILSDVNCKNTFSCSHFAKHDGQICGLKIEGYNLAAGSNDNVVKIWDIRYNKTPLASLQHQAAVRALAWAPWNKKHLFTGGGLHDRQLRIFDTQAFTLVDQVDLEAQISDIVCNENGPKEIAVSLCGKESNLQIFHQQKDNSLTLTAQSEPSDFKIMSLASAEQGAKLVTAQANQAVSIWSNIFTLPKKDPFQTTMSSHPQQLGSFSLNLR